MKKKCPHCERAVTISDRSGRFNTHGPAPDGTFVCPGSDEMAVTTDSEKVRTMLRKIDRHNHEITRLVRQIEESDHPNGTKIFATLQDNGFDNPARAEDCGEEYL